METVTISSIYYNFGFGVDTVKAVEADEGEDDGEGEGTDGDPGYFHGRSSNGTLSIEPNFVISI